MKSSIFVLSALALFCVNECRADLAIESRTGTGIQGSTTGAGTVNGQAVSWSGAGLSGATTGTTYVNPLGDTFTGKALGISYTHGTFDLTFSVTVNARTSVGGDANPFRNAGSWGVSVSPSGSSPHVGGFASFNTTTYEIFSYQLSNLSFSNDSAGKVVAITGSSITAVAVDVASGPGGNIFYGASAVAGGTPFTSDGTYAPNGTVSNTVSIAAQSGSISNFQVLGLNMSFNFSVIPEPSAMMMFGCCMAGIGFRRKRK